ncbi:CapA family protein [Streptomyces pimonensis]|uniref:CapA family protein n=1 Tax=Streptomyces pimonensis TaxID=2860288 RepID=UPI003526C4FF
MPARDSITGRARADAGGTGYDFRPMLSGVRSVVDFADVASCPMGTVYGPGGDRTGHPLLAALPEAARRLAATGYDSRSTSSGHFPDDGAEGIRRTLPLCGTVIGPSRCSRAGTARTPTDRPSGPAPRCAGRAGRGVDQVLHLGEATAELVRGRGGHVLRPAPMTPWPS